MTRDCRPLGSRGGVERIPKFDRYPLPLPRSCPPSPSSGTRDRSKKTAGPFTKRSAYRTCAAGTWL
ncbi:unnamed protein product [Staurois parvus]|uniref:Uncharacterized protein n=1 Tax=Staurois parvus TaxID=386267 RepID=A0ABN9DN19_9NEOB|nr:unnamed protein product [Staurois parvus]